jgi:hypothetical protein
VLGWDIGDHLELELAVNYSDIPNFSRFNGHFILEVLYGTLEGKKNNHRRGVFFICMKTILYEITFRFVFKSTWSY